MLLLRAPKQREIRKVVFSPDSMGIAAEGTSTVVCWPKLGDLAQRSVFESESYGGVDYVAAGTHLVVSNGRGGLWTYPIEGGEGRRCDLSSERIYRFICSPYEPFVLVFPGGADGLGDFLRCYEVGLAGEWNLRWAVDPCRGGCPFFSVDGKSVWQVIYRGMLRYDTISGTAVEYSPAPSDVPRIDPWSVFTQDHALVANAISRHIWIHTLPESPELKITNDSAKDFSGAAFHPSGRFLAASSNDGTVKIYDTSSWRVMTTFAWNIGRLRCVAFSPDGLKAAVGSDSSKLLIWDFDL